MHPHNYFQTIHWALLQTFYYSNWNWNVNGRLQFQKAPTHQCTKVSRRKNFCFLTKKFWKSSELYYLEPGLYPYITDIVETMNTLIQERHNHSENCITVKVSRRTQKVEIYLADEGFSLAFFSTDLRLIFGSIVGNEFGVMFRGKGPHKPEFADNVVRIPSLMIYTDLIEYKIVGDTKAPLLRCFILFRSSRLETIQLLDSTWTIKHLAFFNSNRCSKILFIVFTMIWETRAVKKHLLYLLVSPVLLWCSEKSPTFISILKDVTRLLLQDKWRIHSIEVLVDNVDGVRCICTCNWENCISIFA